MYRLSNYYIGYFVAHLKIANEMNLKQKENKK